MNEKQEVTIKKLKTLCVGGPMNGYKTTEPRPGEGDSRVFFDNHNVVYRKGNSYQYREGRYYYIGETFVCLRIFGDNGVLRPYYETMGVPAENAESVAENEDI